jgi:hypothetical protein
MLPLFQLVLNLTGHTNNILDMYHGEAMAYRTKAGWGNENGRPGELAQWSYSLHLYVYCEEWDLANEMYDNLINEDIGFLRSFPLWHGRVFFFALVAMYNAKRSKGLKRHKWNRAIREHMKLVRMWVLGRRAINVVHKLQILEAVQLTLKRPYPSDKSLMAAFDKGILAASRAGFFHDSALGAAHAARAVSDPQKKMDYAILAQQAYEKWGASGVSRHLAENKHLHRQAAEQSDPDVSGKFLGALRGKERLQRCSTRILSDLHR